LLESNVKESYTVVSLGYIRCKIIHADINNPIDEPNLSKTLPHKQTTRYVPII